METPFHGLFFLMVRVFYWHLAEEDTAANISTKNTANIDSATDVVDVAVLPANRI